MEAVRVRAAHLVRRNWRATVFLVLLAGVAGGIAIGAWTVGRLTTTAHNRFLERSDLPDLTLTFCPPDMTSVDDDTITRIAAFVGSCKCRHDKVLTAAP